ncbi:MAG: 30S ribosome-binding factor RbfA [Firmicutes bacterium]|nr:30S ribosome-binding factor RbfA [Bacillota bacterium]
MGELRREKLRELIKEEVSSILRREMKDPRIGFVTVTDVEISSDLSHVKIYVSVLGDEPSREETMRGLESATGFVRSELGRRIRLRHTPEIVFKFDSSIERGAKVLELLDKVKRGEEAID